jgi:hypothetical protein
MNATGDAGKEQFEKDYDFKRNLNIIKRFISGQINLLSRSNGGDQVDITLSREVDTRLGKINKLKSNIDILSNNKEITIDEEWGDILNSMVDKIDSNRYY